MKFLNLFKKGTKDNSKTSVQKIEKTQLEKIIGGTSDAPVVITPEEKKYGGRVKGSDVILE